MELKDLSQFVEDVWDELPDGCRASSFLGKELLAISVPVVLRLAFHKFFQTEVLPPDNSEHRMPTPTLVPNIVTAAGVQGLIDRVNDSFSTGQFPGACLLAMDILRDVSDGSLPATEDGRSLAYSFVNTARNQVRALARL